MRRQIGVVRAQKARNVRDADRRQEVQQVRQVVAGHGRGEFGGIVRRGGHDHLHVGVQVLVDGLPRRILVDGRRRLDLQQREDVDVPAGARRLGHRLDQVLWVAEIAGVQALWRGWQVRWRGLDWNVARQGGLGGRRCSGGSLRRACCGGSRSRRDGSGGCRRRRSVAQATRTDQQRSARQAPAREAQEGASIDARVRQLCCVVHIPPPDQTLAMVMPGTGG